ncbi:MAG: FIST N-terminal domain-containing protein [Cyanobacteria bacterium P01_C01_bin.121]
MKWVSAISTSASLETAVKEVTQRAKEQLGAQADLAFVFVSVAFASEYARLMPLLQEQLPVAHVIGCSGSGVIGMDDEFPSEIEEGPALSLTAASLPNVNIQSFHLTAADLPDLDSPPQSWSDLIGVTPEAQPSFVLMADPFSSGTSELLQGMDYAYPDATKVGGLAGIESFSRNSGLFCDGKLYREGIVGVALSGEIVLEAIVAQGCRPIGDLYRVSEGDRNIVLKLEPDNLEDAEAAQTPLEILQNIFQGMDEEERELAQNALFIGVAQSGFKPSLTRRDFLIRNLVGVDPRNGAIAVADKIRPGMRVQFHMRDAQTSEEDLEGMLRRYRIERLENKLESEGTNASPVGALLFSCTGRGEGLYDEPNFDSDLFEEYLGPLPVGGFFCNGEIGPVGSTTFLHGFTSVFGICCQPNHSD